MRYLLITLVSFLSLQAKASFDDINYAITKNHLMNGNQTRIENESFLEVIEESFDIPTKSEEEIFQVRNWILDFFNLEMKEHSAFAEEDVNEIYQRKSLQSEHEMALVFIAMIRTLGYPAILVETTSISWSKEFCNQRTSSLPRGKPFVEVFLEGKWILFDPYGGNLIRDFEPADPIIKWDQMPDQEKDGYYVLAKGKDIWDCDIYSEEDLLELQREYAYLILVKEGWVSLLADDYKTLINI